MSDHRKWTSENVRCEQPAEVHGKSLLAMEPLEFCDVPMILKIAIQDIQPYSVLVSWQSREHSGLHGYHVIFHSLDTVEDVSIWLRFLVCHDIFHCWRNALSLG